MTSDERQKKRSARATLGICLSAYYWLATTGHSVESESDAAFHLLYLTSSRSIGSLGGPMRSSGAQGLDPLERVTRASCSFYRFAATFRAPDFVTGCRIILQKICFSLQNISQPACYILRLFSVERPRARD